MKRSGLLLATLLITGISGLPALAAQPAEIEILWEALAPGGGPPTIPATQGDIVYMAATVRDADGEALADIPLKVTSEKGNSVAGPAPKTGENGYAEFNLVINSSGLDTITVSSGKLKDTIRIQAKAPAAVEDFVRQGLPGIEKIDNITGWTTLMQVKLNYDEEYRVSAEFSTPVKKLIGQRVRLAGFMLPLEMSEKQTRFMLSANPPTCFFHLPGGPTTVVEINTRKGVEIGYEPMVVEGTLHADNTSEDGVLYRLRDARVLAP